MEAMALVVVVKNLEKEQQQAPSALTVEFDRRQDHFVLVIPS